MADNDSDKLDPETVINDLEAINKRLLLIIFDRVYKEDAIPSEIINDIESELSLIPHKEIKYAVYKTLFKYTIREYQAYNSRVAITPTMKKYVGDTDLCKNNIYEVIELLKKKIKKYTPPKKGLGGNEPEVITFSDIDITAFIKYLIEKQCFDEADEKDLIKVFNGEIIDRTINYKLTLNSFGTILYELWEAKKVSIKIKKNYCSWIIDLYTYKSKPITRPQLNNLLSKTSTESGRLTEHSKNYINIKSFL